MSKYMFGSIVDRNFRLELQRMADYISDMGYTYEEALQKAHDILDEAQRESNNILGEAERVNALNKNVQQQINTLIAESGTSDAEILQARVDAEGIEYDVLKERLDASDAEVEQSNKIANFARGGLDGAAKITLDIPTYDGQPGVTHPDVVYIPEGWNGYRYWMAFTPYPAGGRENPSVAASNNGQDWEVPKGLTNPLQTNNDANSLGYSYWSDTDIVLTPDNRLAVYFRGSGTDVEGIYRMTSSDGINWGAPEEVLKENTNTSILSPSVVVEEDGTYTMFTIDSDNQIMHKRTSSDGVDWGQPTDCTVPEGVDMWHVTAKKHKGTYHILMASNFTGANGRLHYWTSADGVNFEGDAQPSIPLSGYGADKNGHYRSAFVIIPGNPISFKVWVACWGGNLINPWDVIYYDNIDLKNNTFRSQHMIDDIVKQNEQTFIPVTDLIPAQGSPSESVISSRYKVWRMPKAEMSEISTITLIPHHWNYVRIWIIWTPTASPGEGHVSFSAWLGSQRDLAATTQPSYEWPLGPSSASAGGVYNIRKTFIGAAVRVNQEHNFKDRIFDYIRVRRNGNHSDDTYNGNAGVIGLLIENANDVLPPN